MGETKKKLNQMLFFRILRVIWFLLALPILLPLMIILDFKAGNRENILIYIKEYFLNIWDILRGVQYE